MNVDSKKFYSISNFTKLRMVSFKLAQDMRIGWSKIMYFTEERIVKNKDRFGINKDDVKMKQIS